MGARPLAVASALFLAGAWAGLCATNLSALGVAAVALLLLATALWRLASREDAGWARTVASLALAFALGLARGAAAPRAADDPSLFAWLDDTRAAQSGREPLSIEGLIEESTFVPEGARLDVLIERRETNPGSALTQAAPGLRAILSGPRSLHRGDRVRVLARLHRPEPQRNPGGRDLRTELRHRGIALVGSLDANGIEVLAPGPLLWRMLDELRDYFAKRCAEICTSPQRAALVSSLGVGDRAGLDVVTEEALVDSGLIHLLSSSGLHLAVATVLAASLLRALLLKFAWARRRRASSLAALLALPFIAAQILLLGAPWPALRAGLAAALALTAPLLSRRFDSLTGLLLGICLCGALEPASVEGLPLLLSFTGVLGLILLAPRLREMIPLRRPPPGATLRAHPIAVAREEFIRLACASAAATLCTAPIMAASFHRVSLIAALANAVGLWPGLCALPLASLAVPLESLGHALNLPLALPLVWAADGLAGLVLFFARAFASLPVAAIALPAPGIVVSGLWILALALLAGLPAPWAVTANPLSARPRTLALRAAVPLALLACVVFARHAAAQAEGRLDAIFLSVGEGDATIVRFPDGSAMLVDGGGDLRDLPAPEGLARIDPGSRDVVPALSELGISRLDVIVLSHPHPDHAGGLFSVLRAMPVGELWLTGEPGPLDIGGRLARAANERGVPVRTPRPGEVWTRSDARVEVLAPDPGWRTERSTNDNSLVLRVVHGETALLLAGDVEALAEAQLAQGTRPLHAQLLKAGHHGSRTSSTDAFLRAVAPATVVFSMGTQNPFGFPHPDVVARAEALGARTMRTDQGAVIAESDGRVLRVHSFALP